MMTGVIQRDWIGDPDSHRTTTKSATATVNLKVVLRAIITFSIGFNLRSAVTGSSPMQVID
jgi:hypothetical protein